MPGLVSVLTPSYNCGKYIHRLLDSVLKQTYPSIEMYVIDDGSIDNTKELVESYIPRFIERGYQLYYVYQKNQGQSGAINNGLKMIKGEYLVWPDADDFYKTDDAIESLVKALDESDEQTGMSRCLLDYFREDDLSYIGEFKMSGPVHGYLFENCLYGINGFCFSPGCYMAKMSAIKEMIPDLEIYTEHMAGQNWQLMLPVLYKYKCITIPTIKYSVLIRGVSHSRGQFPSRKQTNKRFNSYRNTVLSTLQRIPTMPPSELKEYTRKVNAQYDRISLKNNLIFLLRPITPAVQWVKKIFGR